MELELRHLKIVLAIAEAVYGPYHPTVATIRSNLAEALRALDDVGQA